MIRTRSHLMAFLEPLALRKCARKSLVSAHQILPMHRCGLGDHDSNNPEFYCLPCLARHLLDLIERDEQEAT